jgi:hypothetical protein
MMTIIRHAYEILASPAQHGKGHVVKSKKIVIVMLTIILALMGTLAVFALDYHIHAVMWDHMNSGMWNQISDQIGDHAAHCETGSGQIKPYN